MGNPRNLVLDSDPVENAVRKRPTISEMIVEARANDGALEVKVLSLEPFKLEVPRCP